MSIRDSTEALFDQHGLRVHAASSPSSSPQPQAPGLDSGAESPSSTSNTSPPSAIPSHVQQGGLGQCEGGASPSGEFAKISIESQSGSGFLSENEGMSSRRVGARSTSPTKRSAADMDGDDDMEFEEPRALDQQRQEKLPGSLQMEQDTGPSHVDQAMSKIRLQNAGSEATQSTSAERSEDATMSTSATSMLPGKPSPPYSDDDDDARWRKGSSSASPAQLPAIDEQVGKVRQMLRNHELDEGTRGYLVASAWLQRVLSRTTEAMSADAKTQYPKDAREGPVGPVDNSSIVPPGGLESQLKDHAGQRFVPLKLGLQRPDDFEVVPEDAWGYMMSLYPPPTVGPDGPTQKIVRYAHNTTDTPGGNISWEYYPPTITIRKVPQSAEQPRSAVAELQKKKACAERGQRTPNDAIRLVSSRSEKFQYFLRRAKEAAGIPLTSKVRIFKQLEPKAVSTDEATNQPNGVMSPPASRASSPSKATKSNAAKLVVSQEEFKKMNLGVELEHLDAQDQTGNNDHDGSSSIETHGLFANAVLILEEQTGGPGGGEYGSDAKKPLKRFNLNAAGSKPVSRSVSPGGILTRGRARANGRTRGTVGLTNLGNTCYMNSALQCIRSVEELALYFLSKQWKDEINGNNPLGHGGKMARQYAELVEAMYSEKAGSSVTPSAFKKQLGNSQPMFSGYGQQDSQEFLSFLVDALHEDLNRIIKKPYNENPDSDDARVRDSEYIVELGETYRKNHRARNDSVAMDLFNGFYKNTMECPTCEKVSVTFDPFSLLTVQLPIENTISHPVTFVPLTGKPVVHQVEIDKNSSVKMLKEYIASQHPAATADRLWMAEIYSHKIYKVFQNSAILGEQNIQPNDYLFVFELEQAPLNHAEKSGYTSTFWSKKDEIPGMDHKKADVFAVPVISRQRRSNVNTEQFLHPLYITVTREEAKDFNRIQKKILYAVAQQTSRPILTEFDKSIPSEAPSTNGNATDKDELSEDVARVSDRSGSSDDFINVSLRKQSQDAQLTNGTGFSTLRCPPNFFDDDYELPAELRNQLFSIKYANASSDGGLHCASMNSFDDKSISTMLERVKQPEPEVGDSIQSSTSPEDSTDANSPITGDDAEESDVDGDETQDDTEKPDIVLGGDGDTTAKDEEDSVDELPKDPLAPRRNQHGKPNKLNSRKCGKRNKKTHSKKKNKRDNNRNHARLDSSASNDTKRSKSNGFLMRLTQQRKQSEDDGEAFCIKLGEAVVLDWYPEGADALFGGDPKDDGDFRGHWLSTEDGRKLDVVKDPVLEAKQAKRQHRKKNGVTLDDCFVETGKREILSEDNAWYCNRCKEMRQAAKTLEIWTAPDILIVHLKRFASVRNFRDKLDVFVDYPIEGLDLSEKIGRKEDGKDYVYDLFAVDNHYGGLGGGHYTAFAKNFFDEQWYDYNDSSCSKIPDARVHSAAAYLLFYRRRSASPLGGPKLQELVDAFRNPPPGSETEDATDAIEAGEVKLGGQTLSSRPLHGSPSAGIAAGAVGRRETLASRAVGGGASGEAIGALIRQPPRMTNAESDEDEAIDMGGGRTWGAQGSSWTFDHLDDDSAPTVALLGHFDGSGGYEPGLYDNIGGGRVGNDDTSSTAAQDDGSDSANDTHMWEDSPTYGPSANTPMDEDAGMLDDHSLYTQGRDVGDTLHIESAGHTGESPPAHDIHLDGGASEEGFSALNKQN